MESGAPTPNRIVQANAHNPAKGLRTSPSATRRVLVGTPGVRAHTAIPDRPDLATHRVEQVRASFRR